MSGKLKILFLSTGNSCRSQMAEGWAHALKSDVIEPCSAGIDISGQKSENVNDLIDIPFDYVVTVCGRAHDRCPVLPGQSVSVVHVGFQDPLARELAAKGAGEEEQLKAYRRVRDGIKAFVGKLPGGLEENLS